MVKVKLFAELGDTMLLNIELNKSYIEATDSIKHNDVGLSIRGSVKQSNAPIPCRIKKKKKLTGRILFDKETDQYGNYEFNHLALSKYFIVAHHPTSQFNAVIQDNVVPK